MFCKTFCIPFSFQHRDALLTTYPSVKHLMCYFHVVKNCKDHLKSFPKEKQKTILCDIQFLHSSTSEEDFSVREVTILQKWYELAPDFVRYFNCQWNADNSFSNWKIFCSKIKQRMKLLYYEINFLNFYIIITCYETCFKTLRITRCCCDKQCY
jgi:hypothetical protein